MAFSAKTMRDTAEPAAKAKEQQYYLVMKDRIEAAAAAGEYFIRYTNNDLANAGCLSWARAKLEEKGFLVTVTGSYIEVSW